MTQLCIQNPQTAGARDYSISSSELSAICIIDLSVEEMLQILAARGLSQMANQTIHRCQTWTWWAKKRSRKSEISEYQILSKPWRIPSTVHLFDTTRTQSIWRSLHHALNQAETEQIRRSYQKKICDQKRCKRSKMAYIISEDNRDALLIWCRLAEVFLFRLDTRRFLLFWFELAASYSIEVA